MINIIPTVDHEIFGNGRGHIENNMINPLKKMANIFDKNGVSLTIFPDITEIMSFKKYSSNLQKYYSKDIYQEVKEQLLDLYSKGHDIQLHVHPQWSDATYKNNNWILPKRNRKIDDFNADANFNSFSFLKENKTFLENMIRDIDKNYEIIAARLTNQGWTQPSKKVSRELIQLGIKYHSLSNNTNKLGLPYWPILNDSGEILYEIPIFTVNRSIINYFSFFRLFLYSHNLIFNSNFIFGYQKSDSKKSKTKRNYLLFRQKLDFCHLSHEEMETQIKIALEMSKKINKTYNIVMISHSKDFFNGKSLDKFLKIMKSKYKDVVSFGKFSNI